jgi:hypothetical protein
LWLVGGGAILVGAVGAFIFLLQRAPTTFRAKVHTKSLIFKLGRWDSAGLFTSETGRVNITLETKSQLTSDAGQKLNCDAGSVLHDVRVLSMSMPEGLKVDLEVEGKGILRYVLSQKNGSPLSLEIGTGETVQSDLKCGQEGGVRGRAVWTVTPLSNEQESGLEFLAKFGLAADRDGAPDNDVLSEENITLEDASGVLFERQGESAVVGADDQLVLNEGAPIAIPNGLRLDDLIGAKIERLNFDPREAALDVTVAGKARGIEIKAGGRETQVAETWLESLFHISWSSFIKAVIGVLSSLAVGIYLKNKKGPKN